MPNNVTNVVIFHGDEQRIHEILESIQMDEIGSGSIDFNKVIPMPPGLDIECGSKTDQGLKLYAEYVQELIASLESGSINSKRQIAERYHELSKDEVFRLGEQACHNLQEHGHTTWYSWSVEHWGTKWNAYGFEDLGTPGNSGTVRFYTAWASPHPILEKLAERYPEIGFTHRWADEDIGSNCGEREYKPGGQMIENLPVDGTKEAYELAADILGCELSEYGLYLSDDHTCYLYREEGEEQTLGG